MTDVPLVRADEVGLRFELPDPAVAVAASAEVIWCRTRYESVHVADRGRSNLTVQRRVR